MTNDLKGIIDRGAARTRRYFNSAQREIFTANLTRLRLCCLFGALLTPLFFALRPLVGDDGFSIAFYSPLAVFVAFFAFSMLAPRRRVSESAVQWACGLFCALLLAALILCGLEDKNGSAGMLAPLVVAALPSLFILPPSAVLSIALAATAANTALNLIIGAGKAASFNAAASLYSLALSLPLLYMITKQRNREHHARHKLRRMGMMDMTSGVLNKAAFEHSAAEYLAERREGELCALFILDLDHFKGVNDTLGHAAGDMLIECVGECLAGCFRSYDTVGRVGGDEFAALMKQIKDLEVVSRKAAEVQRRILSESFERVGCEVSCSIGVAYTTAAIDYGAFYKSADKNLYRAKRAGRARAVVKFAAGADALAPDTEP